MSSGKISEHEKIVADEIQKAMQGMSPFDRMRFVQSMLGGRASVGNDSRCGDPVEPVDPMISLLHLVLSDDEKYHRAIEPAPLEELLRTFRARLGSGSTAAVASTSTTTSIAGSNKTSLIKELKDIFASVTQLVACVAPAPTPAFTDVLRSTCCVKLRALLLSPNVPEGSIDAATIKELTEATLAEPGDDYPLAEAVSKCNDRAALANAHIAVCSRFTQQTSTSFGNILGSIWSRWATLVASDPPATEAMTNSLAPSSPPPAAANPNKAKNSGSKSSGSEVASTGRDADERWMPLMPHLSRAINLVLATRNALFSIVERFSKPGSPFLRGLAAVYASPQNIRRMPLDYDRLLDAVEPIFQDFAVREARSLFQLFNALLTADIKFVEKFSVHPMRMWVVLSMLCRPPPGSLSPRDVGGDALRIFKRVALMSPQAAKKMCENGTLSLLVAGLAHCVRNPTGCRFLLTTIIYIVVQTIGNDPKQFSAAVYNAANSSSMKIFLSYLASIGRSDGEFATPPTYRVVHDPAIARDCERAPFPAGLQALDVQVKWSQQYLSDVANMSMLAKLMMCAAAVNRSQPDQSQAEQHLVSAATDDLFDAEDRVAPQRQDPEGDRPSAQTPCRPCDSIAGPVLLGLVSDLRHAIFCRGDEAAAKHDCFLAYCFFADYEHASRMWASQWVLDLSIDVARRSLRDLTSFPASPDELIAKSLGIKNKSRWDHWRQLVTSPPSAIVPPRVDGPVELERARRRHWEYANLLMQVPLEEARIRAKLESEEASTRRDAVEAVVAQERKKMAARVTHFKKFQQSVRETIERDEPNARRALEQTQTTTLNSIRQQADKSLKQAQAKRPGAAASGAAKQPASKQSTATAGVLAQTNQAATRATAPNEATVEMNQTDEDDTDAALVEALRQLIESQQRYQLQAAAAAASVHRDVDRPSDTRTAAQCDLASLLLTGSAAAGTGASTSGAAANAKVVQVDSRGWAKMKVVDPDPIRVEVVVLEMAAGDATPKYKRMNLTTSSHHFDVAVPVPFFNALGCPIGVSAMPKHQDPNSEQRPANKKPVKRGTFPDNLIARLMSVPLDQLARVLPVKRVSATNDDDRGADLSDAAVEWWAQERVVFLMKSLEPLSVAEVTDLIGQFDALIRIILCG